jgi:2-polyprenyl-6-methoxyphenol hydroxylase-like FAD-dependent oxidoreductase
MRGNWREATMSEQHAVVIGASITGLVTARVLSNRFQSVTIVERDAVPMTYESRPGVPQGRHGHGLLASGFDALKGLFPGIERDLLAAGARAGDVIGDVRWFQHGYYKAKFPSGFGGILLSRPLLEGVVRDRVRRLPNVRVLDKTHVRALVVDSHKERVNGLRIQQRGDEPSTLEAALVVDASGRSSKAPEWLRELGYDAPKTETVEVGIGYTTRTFRRRPQDLNGDVAAIIAPHPSYQKRVGFILAMEHDRWIVSIGGWLGDHAPTDPEGFLEFARTLARPDIYEVIKDAEPLTDAVTYAFPSNQRRRYERLQRFPEALLVIGDAICSFNPVYGQGMSVAALEALALEQCLSGRSSLEGLWRSFFRSAARIIDTPWMIAAGSDFAFPGVTGSKPGGTDLVNWYLERVHRAASTNRIVCRTFFDVANMLKPATTLFHPAVVARVAKECVWPSSPPQQTQTPDRAESGQRIVRPA